MGNDCNVMKWNWGTRSRIEIVSTILGSHPPYPKHCVHIHPDPPPPTPPTWLPPPPQILFFFVNFLKNFNSSVTSTLTPLPDPPPPPQKKKKIFFLIFTKTSILRSHPPWHPNSNTPNPQTAPPPPPNFFLNITKTSNSSFTSTLTPPPTQTSPDPPTKYFFWISTKTSLLCYIYPEPPPPPPPNMTTPPSPQKIYFFEFSQKLQFFLHIHPDPPPPPNPTNLILDSQPCFGLTQSEFLNLYNFLSLSNPFLLTLKIIFVIQFLQPRHLGWSQQRHSNVAVSTEDQERQSPNDEFCTNGLMASLGTCRTLTDTSLTSLPDSPCFTLIHPAIPPYKLELVETSLKVL